MYGDTFGNKYRDKGPKLSRNVHLCLHVLVSVLISVDKRGPVAVDVLYCAPWPQFEWLVIAKRLKQD